MELRWKTKKGSFCDYNVIIEEMEPSRRVTSEGKGVFENRHVQFDWMALAGAIDFPKEISDHQARLLTSEGVCDAAALGKLTPNSILAGVSERARAFLKIRPRTFLIATSLSIKVLDSLKSRTYLGSRIQFLKAYPSRLKANEVYEKARRDGLPQIPEDYCRILVTIRAREIFGAMDEATRRLDLLRGIWNLELNRRKGIQYHSGPNRPVNAILIGPVHTIHALNGESADETYWYEAGFPSVIPAAIDIGQSFGKIADTEKVIRRQLVKSRFAKLATQFLIDYARALDSADLFKVYLSLWGLLERLTLTSERDGHDVTARRASFVWNRPKYQRQFVNYLRTMRNEIVHRGEFNQPVKELIDPLRFSIEQLMRFWILNPFRLKTSDEFSSFFDLSPARADLQKEIRLRKYALRYHHPRNRKK